MQKKGLSLMAKLEQLKTERREAARKAREILDEYADGREMPVAVRKALDAATADAERLGKHILAIAEDEAFKREQREIDETIAKATAGTGLYRPTNTWADKVAQRIMSARADTRALNSGSIDVTVPMGRVVEKAGIPTRVYELLDMKAGGEGNGTSYLRQTVRTDNAEFVADSGTKPTSVYTLVAIEDRLRVLAHLSEAIPQRYLDDSEAIRRFLEAEMEAGLLARLDEAILLGDDTAGTDEFDGIKKLAGTAVAFDTDVVKTAANALTGQLDIGEEPNAWVFRSSDWQGLSLTREETNGQYLFGVPADGPGRRLHGLPVVLSPNMTAGFAMLGDFAQADLIAKDATIAWNGADAALFDANLVKVRVEMRVVLRVFRPAAFKLVDIVTP